MSIVQKTHFTSQAANVIKIFTPIKKVMHPFKTPLGRIINKGEIWERKPSYIFTRGVVAYAGVVYECDMVTIPFASFSAYGKKEIFTICQAIADKRRCNVYYEHNLTTYVYEPCIQ